MSKKKGRNRGRSAAYKANKANKSAKAEKAGADKIRILLYLLVGATAVIIIINMFSMLFGSREKGEPEKIAIAMVSCAENATFDYTANYSFIENIKDGAGYTGGIIGFTSMTGDMFQVVKQYCEKEKDSPLKKYIKPLADVVGTDKTYGLGKGFVKAWKKAGEDRAMREVQDSFRDRLFLKPAFDAAKKDGLSTLGKYIYYDTAVQHGPEGEGSSLANLRKTTIKKAKTPANGGDEKKYLTEFLKVREKALKKMKFKVNMSRIEVQKKLVKDEEFEMLLPLEFTMYGKDYKLEDNDLI